MIGNNIYNRFGDGYFYRFRVGDRSDETATDRFKFCGPELRLKAQDASVRTTMSNGAGLSFFPSTDVRYSLSADLAVGRLSASIWLTNRPAEKNDWFSVAVPPLILAAAVPVAYLDGEYLGGAGTMAILTYD